MGVVTAASSSSIWAKVSLKQALTEALMLGNHDLALRLADLNTPPVPAVIQEPRGNRLLPISGEIEDGSTSTAA